MTAAELTPAEIPLSSTASTTWPFAKRWLLAFAAAFFVFQNGWLPITLVPFISDAVEKVWNAMTGFVATYVFHVTIDTTFNGSGDSTYGYMGLALNLGLALAVGLVVAALVRSRAHNELLRDVFRVYLRFTLGFVMISYGAAKIIQQQFPPPTLDRLVEPFGAASPMGLLWTFMGASRAYNVLTGSVEMLGGLLLATRRTALLGALVCAGAMANVVALNFCYDVPVKLYSMQLLLEALIIASFDFRSMARFFVLERNERPLFRKPWAIRTAFAAGVLFIATSAVLDLRRAVETRRTIYLGPVSPLRGIWSVDELTDNGVSRPPLMTDLPRWRRVIIDRGRYAFIQLMSDARFRYRITLDEKKHTFELADWENPKSITKLAYLRNDARTLTLDATTPDGHKLHAVCHLSDAAMNPLLTTRGFHWINEVPFNR